MQNLCPVIDWLEAKVIPSSQELAAVSPATRHLWLCKSQLLLKDTVLLYRWVENGQDRLKLVVPFQLRTKVLFMVHDAKSGGHFGEDRTFQRLSYCFFWHGASVDCRILCAELCDLQQEQKVIGSG